MKNSKGNVYHGYTANSLTFKLQVLTMFHIQLHFNDSQKIIAKRAHKKIKKYAKIVAKVQ